MTKSQRPLSPHLQIYRPQISMVLSILHRMTGVALLLGAAWLTWWLTALAAGPEAFAQQQRFAASPVGQIALAGLAWSLFYHLCNGLRHLAWDAGYGFALPAMRKSGWAVVIGSFALTALAWIASRP
jgi:succinate dehydrogenase / fumarate reductase, cytochrome b subunit